MLLHTSFYPLCLLSADLTAIITSCQSLSCSLTESGKRESVMCEWNIPDEWKTRCRDNEDFWVTNPKFYSQTLPFAILTDGLITSALVHCFCREICRWWLSPSQDVKLTLAVNHRHDLEYRLPRRGQLPWPPFCGFQQTHKSFLRMG